MVAKGKTAVSLTYKPTTKPPTMKASELKINDTIRRDGYKFTVKEIIHETYKNGTPSLLICCTMGDSQVVDSFFHIKPTTKVK